MNNNNATIEKMKSMRLHGMAEGFKNLLETGKTMKLTIDEALYVKIDDSKTFRKESSIYEVQYGVSEQCVEESVAA